MWTDKHEKHLNQVKEEIAESTENKHFKQNLETRRNCEASRKGLGIALEQRTPGGCIRLAFSNILEERHRINKLELLGVVWPLERFIYYLYGKPCNVIINYRALL